jgi:hypothetical protein
MERICSIIEDETQKSWSLFRASNQVIYTGGINKMTESIIQQKSCSSCQQTQPVSSFSNNIRQKDGKDTFCKKCQSEYHNQWKANNSNAVKQIAANRRNRLKIKRLCLHCSVNPAQKFKSCCERCSKKQAVRRKTYRIEQTQKGFCASCLKTPYLVNTVKSFPLCETCYFKQKARRNLGNGLFWQQIKAKLEQQNYLCPYTGEKLILGVNDSLDHIKPINHFPELKNDIENIEWTTRAINEMKRDRTPEQFLSFIQHILNYKSKLGIKWNNSSCLPKESLSITVSV